MSLSTLGHKPLLSLTDGPITNLKDLLVSRELRAKRQQHWLSLYCVPLISFTLVIPGEIKKSSGALFLFDTALATLDLFFNQHNINVKNQQVYVADTGYEALMAIDLQSTQLKDYMVQLEIQHPLGRFWDLDVIDFQGIVSRKYQKLPIRTCLVCDEAAHVCARSRHHNIQELLYIIENKINVFNERP